MNEWLSEGSSGVNIVDYSEVRLSAMSLLKKNSIEVWNAYGHLI